MPNLSGDAYGLTVLSPIINRHASEQSYTVLLRELLDNLPTGENSPFSAIPETYLCRLFVLDNVVYQSLDIAKLLPMPVPPRQDQLKSAYLVFECNFHGPDLDPYLWSMWAAAQHKIAEIWKYCVGFEKVHDADSFAKYIKRCQVETTFYFNGSTDESLAEQLKGLYLKQELSKFAYAHQDLAAEELQAAFFDFVERTQPENLAGPTWRAGATTLDVTVIGEPLPRGAESPAPGHRPTPTDVQNDNAEEEQQAVAQ